MKRTAAFVLLISVICVLAPSASAVPQHFVSARFEGTGPGNAEVLDRYYPAAVAMKSDIYNLGGGLEYDFALTDFLTVGAGLGMHFKSYQNMVASSNLEEFRFMAVEPYAVARAFHKAGEGFELFGGLAAGLDTLAASSFRSGVTPSAKEMTGACTGIRVFAGVTYYTGVWYNMIEAGYKFAKMDNYQIGGARALNASGGPAYTDFGGIYLGLSSGVTFGGEKKAKEYHAGNPYDWALFAQAENGETATDASYAPAGQQETPAPSAEAAPDPSALAQETPAAEATAVPAAEPTATPAAVVQEPQSATIEVDDGAEGNGDGIVIIYPGETNLEELEKSILSRRTVSQEAPEEEEEGESTVTFEAASEEPEQPDVIMLEDKKQGRIESAGYVMVERVGFISDNFPEEGTLFDVNDKSLLAQGDSCYIRLSVGKGVKKGTEFVIFDDKEEVTDTETGEPLGRYINIVGVGKVVEKADDNTWKIKITKSYSPAATGYKIKLRKDIKAYYNKITTKLKKKSAAVQGVIVKMQQGSEGAASKGVVFFNRGLKSGIAPGDRMDVIRPMENKEQGTVDTYHKIGRILVINAMRSSSVGLVLNQADIIRTGDIVKTVK